MRLMQSSRNELSVTKLYTDNVGFSPVADIKETGVVDARSGWGRGDVRHSTRIGDPAAFIASATRRRASADMALRSPIAAGSKGSSRCTVTGITPGRPSVRSASARPSSPFSSARAISGPWGEGLAGGRVVAVPGPVRSATGPGTVRRSQLETADLGRPSRPAAVEHLDDQLGHVRQEQYLALDR